MGCDISGGCKICPGMWIAVALLVVMAIQSWLFPARPTREPVSDNSATSTLQPDKPAEAASDKL